MSERIRIDKVSAEPDTWSNRYGTYQGYDLDLEKENGEIEIGVGNNRKLKADGSHFEPKPGEEVWGTIVPDGRGGQKLEIDQTRMKNEPLDGSGSSQTRSQPSGGSQGTPRGSGGSETNWEVRNAEIRRQHSQQVALEYLALTEFSVDPVNRSVALSDILRPIADWFDQDAIAAGQKASGEQPVDFTGASSSGASSEFPDSKKDHDDFMALLDSKGITNPEAASTIADFYMSLEPKRQLKLGNALMGSEYTTVLDALVAQTEAWANKKLPSLTSSSLEAELNSELPF